MEADQEEEATRSCYQWLLLRTLAWMLQQQQFHHNWMPFSQCKNYIKMELKAVLDQ